MNTNELWKDIDGFNGRYQVSNFGRVRSTISWNGHKYVSKERILKPSMTTTGYHKIELIAPNGKKKSLKLHRVIASAFIPNPMGYPIINHKDGNPLNNSLDNLEWCTQKHNVEHAITMGLHKYSVAHTPREEEICNLYVQGHSSGEIAEIYGITRNSVMSTIRRNGIEVYPQGHFCNKYHIDLEELKSDFDRGIRNRDLAIKYGCSPKLIGRRKWQYKKGEI